MPTAIARWVFPRPVEHEVLGGVDEGQALEVLDAVPVRERHLGEVVAVEGLHLRELRPPVEPCPLAALPHFHFMLYQVAHNAELRRVGPGQEPFDGFVAEVELAGQGAQALGIVLGSDRHATPPFPSRRRRRVRHRLSTRPPPAPPPRRRSPHRACPSTAGRIPWRPPPRPSRCAGPGRA